MRIARQSVVKREETKWALKREHKAKLMTVLSPSAQRLVCREEVLRRFLSPAAAAAAVAFARPSSIVVDGSCVPCFVYVRTIVKGWKKRGG